MVPSTVLAVLAELAPAGGDRVLDVGRGGQPIVWLDDAERAPRRKEVDRLAAIGALHRDERPLRRGWGFLVGRAEVEGKQRKIRVPLLSQPVQLERGLLGYRVVAAGDVEITPLIEDRNLAAALEAAPGVAGPGWLEATGSKAWLWSAAEATGLSVDAVAGDRRAPNDRVVLMAEAALFVVRDVFGAGLADSLRSWASRDLTGTALAAVYADGHESPAEGASPPGRDGRGEGASPTGRDRRGKGASSALTSRDRGEAVLSPMPLNEAQAEVVARARTETITVVSGPPGNGKSHTVVAAALEVVHRGGSVLVATQSPHAAEVLARLLERYPGPVPVLFGDAARRESLAAELTGGLEQGATDDELKADAENVRKASDAVRDIRAGLTAALDLEVQAAALPEWQPRLAALAGDAPGAFTDDADPGKLRARLDGGRLARWWARRLLGARKDVPKERLTDALTAATAQRAAARLAATGGTELAAQWAAWHDAEQRLAAAVGAAMRRAARSRQRWDKSARRAAADLAAALRAGRNRRRELLAGLPAGPLVNALPLWIGTVADVEDLLPAAPGMFDLVVLDEASHVDQVRAAPVLARAKRALVVGDPRQLRFVSFVSDVDVAEVLQRHGADERLDVRRVSAYDLAAGAAPATWLAEHHRSVPHLIGFAARRFYGDRLDVLTRTPAGEGADAIDIVRAPDELAAVLKLVEAEAAAGTRGIGVISPFRPQADALEAALVEAYSVERIEELGLRTGTVHAFQGSEADVVIVSLGLQPDDSPTRRRFVADPNLFNVMVTRARRRLVVVTALDRADGLIGDFFAYADAVPTAPAENPATGWAAELAAELHRLDVETRPAYAVGSWTIDLCIGPPGDPTGVFCEPHPDGTEAHLARQCALARKGWRLRDGFASRWAGDPRRAALDLASDLRTPGP
ncbi:AAA domain-containing protein [Actinoplanes sp. TRM 88003]|uniref:AAA domain-containing protein n=1 Tax=Paractinoplanes aksuensis TaxID=2939490 RepID=A0ABT1DRR2_9ACTN|nr:AAA domain-containing protein [Actinoplanes aksuensis]MCO8273522.1 AAA domain-containing protein [Actinoplanes aksuensis]